MVNLQGIRRALILMTIDRYFSMVVNFAQIAILSRILAPSEIGVSVIGVSVTAISLAVREFASSGYIIQKPTITLDDKRTLATLSTLFGVAIAAICFVLAPFIETMYGTPGVASYLRVCAAALVIEGINVVFLTLMRRDLQFNKVMICNMTNMVVGLVAVVLLALNGFSFLSFGYAWLCSISIATLVAFALRPELTVFVPSLREWRGLMSFGVYNGAAAVLSRAYDSLPLLLFGRTMGLHATGFFFRALNICQLPDKMFLAGVLQVALPALSRAAANGVDMKAAYLRGVQQITALYWPALLMMAILAHPIVDLLLGPKWAGVVPLVQIMALSWMFAFSNDLSYSVLVSLGGIRDHLLRNAIIWPLSGAILVGASFGGPLSAAMGLAVAVPIQWLVSFLILRRRLPMTFAEMLGALKGSAVVSLATVAGPLLAIYGLLDGKFAMSLFQAVGLGALSGVCWITALRLTKHPLWTEIEGVLARAVAKVRPEAG